MKSNKKKGILLTLLLIIPILKVYADNIILECPKEIKESSEFTCRLKGSSEKSISSLSLKINLSDSLILNSFIPSSGWRGDGEEGKVDLQRLEGVTNIFDIGTINLKNTGGDNNALVLDPITFYEGEENDFKGEKIAALTETIGIKINSDTNVPNNNIDNSNNHKDNLEDEDNNKAHINLPFLSDIKIVNYSLPFVKDKYEYVLTIKDENRLDIFPMAEENDLLYEIEGNENLQNGSVIKITVISQKNNSQNHYFIKIKKDGTGAVKEKTTGNYKIIFISIIVTLVIINIVRLIVNNRRYKNEKENS